MSRDKILLAKLIKSWAQEHNSNYLISDPDGSDEAMNNTSAYLTWVIKQTECNIDLLSLLDRLDVYMARRGKKIYSDGLSCSKCKNYYNYAEPNMPDGTLLCYSCKSNPYY